MVIFGREHTSFLNLKISLMCTTEHFHNYVWVIRSTTFHRMITRALFCILRNKWPITFIGVLRPLAHPKDFFFFVQVVHLHTPNHICSSYFSEWVERCKWLMMRLEHSVVGRDDPACCLAWSHLGCLGNASVMLTHLDGNTCYIGQRCYLSALIRQGTSCQFSNPGTEAGINIQAQHVVPDVSFNWEWIDYSTQVWVRKWMGWFKSLVWMPRKSREREEEDVVREVKKQFRLTF